jgi:hypothetical protein
MKAQVVGIGKRRTGVSRNTGKPYDGIPVYILYCSGDVDGYKTGDTFFNYLNDTDFPKVEIGDLIEIDYNSETACSYIERVTVIRKAKGVLCE